MHKEVAAQRLLLAAPILTVKTATGFGVESGAKDSDARMIRPRAVSRVMVKMIAGQDMTLMVRNATMLAKVVSE